ncbi:hypothetical protein Celaphus_00012129 [Cervus elaphus hippelaphus]|uniref:Peptidase M12B domain-containing protein n=1 Tax=Cervus elaphus hippelaphus TaxID=46360 RepID=A0A212CKE5_CEREH|nr:hypothetical protein Celaphus_00012129 [Cervus elaphus hippelaphus]
MTTQDEQEGLQMDCYYLGYLDEIPLCMVTVDTSIKKLDDLTYEIKPLKDSKRFEHRWFLRQWQMDLHMATGSAYEWDKVDREPLFPKADAKVMRPPTDFSSTFTVIRNVPEDGQFYCSYHSICTSKDLIFAGWNLGTRFDADVRCLCIRTTCILYKFPVLTDSFRNCSILHFQYTVYKLRHCL